MIGASVLGVQKILNARAVFFCFSSAVHAVRVSRVSFHPFCDVCMCDDYISTIYTWRLWWRTWCTHTHKPITISFRCSRWRTGERRDTNGVHSTCRKYEEKQLHYVDESIRRECLVAAAGTGWCRCVAKYPNDFLLIAVSSVCVCVRVQCSFSFKSHCLASFDIVVCACIVYLLVCCRYPPASSLCRRRYYCCCCCVIDNDNPVAARK